MFHRKFDTKYKLFKYCHVNGGSKPPPYDLIDKREFDFIDSQCPGSFGAGANDWHQMP